MLVDQNGSMQAVLPDPNEPQGPSSSSVETTQQILPNLRDPRIEALRAELQGSSLASGQSTPGTGTGTGIATASGGTSAPSPASDGHVTPAPIAVNIDDELDLMNLNDQKTQVDTREKQELSVPAAATPTLQPQNKAAETGELNEHSDIGSDANSESDYESNSEAEEPDCRVIVNVSPPTRISLPKLMCYVGSLSLVTPFGFIPLA